jgi:hypothetical protein
MKLEIKDNKNYCATVIKIENTIPLENCDNIIGTSIFGNHVIVSKDTQIGDIGLFFPVETQLLPEFLKPNNLYRDKVLNGNAEKAGFFEIKGRVKCMKFRGYKSEGFFIPLDSIQCIAKYTDGGFKIGDEFDTIDNVQICKKYLVVKSQPMSRGERLNRRLKIISRLIDNQFRFHLDTEQLGKNIYKVKEDALISLSYKIHGTSFIVSNILCKRKLTFIEKIFIYLRRICE